jgi:hypothetical protein
MKRIIPLLLLLTLMVVGCQSALFTALYLVKGRDEPPKYDILLKGEKRVAVVPRAAFSNAFELQNAPREIARNINVLLDENVRNKKLRVVEQSKVETWLDNVNNDFDSLLEVGRDRSIQADIVIGFDILEFRIRDPLNAHLVQGRCHVQVTAIDCATGRVLVSETLMIVDPPNMPMQSNARLEPQFRTQFMQVVAEQIAALFHHHDPHRIRRMDVDNLEMHRLQ